MKVPQPKFFKFRRLLQQLSYMSRQWRHNFVSKIYFTFGIYLISYNVLVRLWKGPEHPVNRFRWRIMEYRGELSDEMIRKKRVTQNFYPALQNYLKEYRDKSFAKYLNP